MSIIGKIHDELKTAENPVALALRHGEGFKVLYFGFKNGMVIKDHEADLPSKIFVLKGRIQCNTEGHAVMLQENDEYEIPAHTLHNIVAHADSFCLLVQGGE